MKIWQRGWNYTLNDRKNAICEIRYSALPMEYPPTSPEGIAVVYKKTKLEPQLNPIKHPDHNLKLRKLK